MGKGSLTTEVAADASNDPANRCANRAANRTAEDRAAFGGGDSDCPPTNKARGILRVFDFSFLLRDLAGGEAMFNRYGIINT